MKAAKAVGIVVVLVQAVTLCTLFLTTDLPERENYFFDAENMFEFSEEGNIVTVISDSLESQYVTRAIEEYPEFKQKLEGFTFFPNTVSASSFTNASLPVLITGIQLPLDGTASEGMRKCVEETDVFDALHSNGYQYNCFTNYIRLNKDDLQHFANVKQVDESIFSFADALKTSLTLSETVMYKTSPHYLKAIFINGGALFSSPWWTISAEKFGIVGFRYGYNEDVTYKKRIADEVSVTAENKQYLFLHLYGIHLPYTRSRSLEPDDTISDLPIPADEKRYQIALGQLDLLCELVDKLKENGIFDCTTIVFAADHGHLVRYNPTYMVKEANSKHSFRVSEAPVDYSTDFVRFIKDSAAGLGSDAALFSIPDNLERKRFVYNYYSDAGYSSNITYRTKIAVTGKAYDETAYTVIGDEYSKIGTIDEKYSLGDEIPMKFNSENADISGVGLDGVCISKTARVVLEFEEAPTETLTASLGINKVFNSPQRLIITANGKRLFNESVAEGQKAVAFAVPTEALNGSRLELNFEMPDIKIEEGETITYPLTFYSFGFGELVIE